MNGKGVSMVIEINTQSAVPIYEQLRNQIVLGIASHRLMPGEALPSVRRLAADLGINFHTVNKAYTALCDEGYIVIDRRKGALVKQGDEDLSRGVFIIGLKERLMLCAAEALCHGLTIEAFAGLCAEAMRDTKNVK
jgi:DNA-binding transcriptional regulator YhcF (GntR family)